MIEALWSIQFVANNGDNGAGVVVFENGRLFGGDSTYYYVGNYSIKDGVLNAEVHVNHYSGPRNNIVGPVDKVTWLLSGRIANDVFDITGTAQDHQEKVLVRLTRRAELPN